MLDDVFHNNNTGVFLLVA